MDERLTAGRYEIVVGADLDSDQMTWFDGFAVVDSGEVSVLRGVVADQSALHGVLSRLRDLAIPLLDVHRIEDVPDQSKTVGTAPDRRTEERT